MEVESELRVASDRILKSLEQLDALETEKRTLKPDNPRFQVLAKEIERLAADIFAQSHAQQRLGERAKSEADQTGESLSSIDDTVRTRDIATILAEWRDAERRFQSTAPDSAEHALAIADVNRLREEYRAASSASEHESRS